MVCGGIIAPGNREQKGLPMIELRHIEVTRSAWKLGGTNRRSQSHFGNAVPLFGELSLDNVFQSGDPVPFSDSTCLELELAVKIPKRNFDSLEFALCFEIPQKRIGSEETEFEKILSDRCGAHALVVQEKFHMCERDLRESRFHLKRNSSLLETTTLGNLVSSPREILFSFLSTTKRLGVTTRPGDIVALGGLGECYPVAQGHEYQASNPILGELNAVFT